MIDLNAYHRAVELSHIRQYMKYNETRFRQDWELSIALAILLAMGHTEKLEFMLDSCMKRIQAYVANNPDARPWSTE
jgi:hypothetical protein